MSSSLGSRPAPPVLLSLGMGAFSFGLAEFAPMSLLPYIARGLAVSEPKAGHIISAYAVGVVIGAPVITVLSARLSRRRLLLTLMALFVVANGLSALAPSFGWLVLCRLLAGFPHGAFLGIAALVAAAQVGPTRKAWAVSRVYFGLTAATLLGVPVVSWLAQHVEWRWCFGLMTLLSLLAAALLLFSVPFDKVKPDASALRELGALRRGQVWLTLAIGSIGFGGMFAVYAYLTSTLINVTALSPSLVPLMFCLFGLGLTVGNLVAPTFADRAVMPSAGAVLLWSMLTLIVYPLAAHSPLFIGIDIFLIGCSQALGVVLQARLMEVAGDAQALGAALNHSAFNVANAVGPLLGGLAISAGFGWTSTGPVGAALAACGLAIWLISVNLDHRAKAAISRA